MNVQSAICDVAYGPHPRHRLDFWPVETAEPAPLYLFFHGGGFVQGDKRDLPPVMRDALLAGGIAVASANYRFTDDPELFAPLRDGERALQFLRARAVDWNVDPRRVAAGGSSAGSVTAFWLGCRPDAANPGAGDPVARQSTRLACIGAFEAQTTLDMHRIRACVPGPTWTIDTVEKLVQLPLDRYATPLAHARFREMAFTDMVDRDSPPVFLFNLTPDLPLTPELPIAPGIHHPVLGRLLKESMDRCGVECVLRVREDLPDLNDNAAYAAFQQELAAFVIRHLRGGRS